MEQLETAVDVDAALRVRREDLSDARAHSQVIAFLEAHDRAPSSARKVSLGAEILTAEPHRAEACAVAQPPAVYWIEVLCRIALHVPADQQEAVLARC